MELTLSDIISELLALFLKSLSRDAAEFFASVRYVRSLFFIFSSNDKCTEVQQLMPDNNCDQKPCQQVVSHNNEISQVDNQICAHDVNMVMHDLGLKYKLEGIDGSSIGYVGEKVVVAGLFDEEEPSFEELKEAFYVFDTNEDGYIDPIELQRVVNNLGFKDYYDVEKCKRMIKSFDTNGDGLIDLKEFVIFMENFF